MMFTAYSGVLPLLRADWNMSAGEAGLIQSAWHLGYLISLFIAGFLSDRFGAKRTFLAGNLLAAASAMVFAVFTDGFVSALLLHGLLGLCSGSSYTPGLTLISERFSPHRRGRAMGFYLAASSLGYAVALLLSGALVASIGWRSIFIATACGPLAAAGLVFHTLRETPNIVHPTPAAHGAGPSLVEVLRNRPAMLLIWAYTFHSWELLGMWAWLPAFLAISAAAGGDVTAQAVGLGALLSAVTYVSSMAGSIAGGSFSDRWGRTTVILAMSCASLACSFAFGWMVAWPLWLLLVVAVLYNVTAIGDSSVYSTAVTELVPPRCIGAAYSIRSVLGFGAGAVSPWTFGLVLDWARSGPLHSESWAWGLAWTSLGIGALLGPLMTWQLRRMPEAARMAGGKR
ncbi:MAG: MFS transporter [Betaproteobacteria bacterium]|nr:MFS transporter [Betaproteobacteria bacterium]MBI2509874.1 MFS transporter [Betaproteobacteria bacterium]